MRPRIKWCSKCKYFVCTPQLSHGGWVGFGDTKEAFDLAVGFAQQELECMMEQIGRPEYYEGAIAVLLDSEPKQNGYLQ